MSLAFFSQIRVTNSVRFPEYNGKLGVVIGKSEEDEVIYSYTVTFPYSGDESLTLRPEEIEATGVVVSRDLIYSNVSVRVRVDGDEGFFVEEASDKKSDS